MRVRVYRNLHRNCYSIQKKDDDGRWRVWSYRDEMVLHNPKFVVREGGRQKVIREQMKNVHAFIEGDLLFDDVSIFWPKTIQEKPPEVRPEYHLKIKYNPYTDSFFHINGISVKNDNFSFVYLTKDGVFI